MLASLIKLGSIVFASVFWKRSLLAKSLQSRSTLCDPIDSSPPGSHVPGILQVKILEWVAISFSRRARLDIEKRGTVGSLVPFRIPRGIQSGKSSWPKSNMGSFGDSETFNPNGSWGVLGH